MENVLKIGSIIGRPVLSLQTANKLGQVDDLVVDPLKGRLAGFSIQRGDETHALVEWRVVHSVGADAIMVDRDDSPVEIDRSPITVFPQAKKDLIGVKVITEHGQLMGKISDLFLCLTEAPLFIYEVRSSIFDKLLGQAFYFAASLGCAFSDDATSLIVTDDPDRMDHDLTATAQRLLGPYDLPPYQAAAMPRIEVRTRSQEP
jgi:uncharacterized protein YrrD